MPLLCETNTLHIQRCVTRAFRQQHGDTHEHIRAVFEHGQWYVTCPVCGAMWSAHDVEPTPEARARNRWAGTYPEPLGLEQIHSGDGHCESR